MSILQKKYTRDVLNTNEIIITEDAFSTRINYLIIYLFV